MTLLDSHAYIGDIGLGHSQHKHQTADFVSDCRPRFYWQDDVNLRTELEPYVSAVQHSPEQAPTRYLPTRKALLQDGRTALATAVGARGGMNSAAIMKLMGANVLPRSVELLVTLFWLCSDWCLIYGATQHLAASSRHPDCRQVKHLTGLLKRLSRFIPCLLAVPVWFLAALRDHKYALDDSQNALSHIFAKSVLVLDQGPAPV